MTLETKSLYYSWMKIKKGEKPIRIRNAAVELGVSEVQLLATEIQEGTVTRLRPEFKGILGEIETLGKVMALTRNDEVVHERKGVYLNGSFGPHTSLFAGEDIDLRIFLNRWKSVFSVEEPSGNQMRRSLQFFDLHGTAMHKIYLTPQSNEQEFQKLVDKYKDEDQKTEEIVQPNIIMPKDTADISDLDIKGFQENWLKLKDTHDFFMMLRKFKMDRVTALECAPEGDYAVEVGPKAVREICGLAVETETPIMVFVGNPGMIQIHTGPIKKLLDHGPWFNIMDPDFNMHLNESKIHRSFIVRKPTEDGIVTSLEVFNREGDLIVTFFGKRKPGIPELDSWRVIAKTVETSLKL